MKSKDVKTAFVDPGVNHGLLEHLEKAGFEWIIFFDEADALFGKGLISGMPMTNMLTRRFHIYCSGSKIIMG